MRQRKGPSKKLRRSSSSMRGLRHGGSRRSSKSMRQQLEELLR